MNKNKLKEVCIEIAEDIRDGNTPSGYSDDIRHEASEYLYSIPHIIWSPPEPFCSDAYDFHWHRINDAGDLAAIQVAFFVPDCLAYCEEFDKPKWVQVACTKDGYGEIQDIDCIKERFDTYLNHISERTAYIDRKRADLVKRFSQAAEEEMDELDFFLELTGNGVTLKDIYRCAPEYYDYSKKFMEEHGLVKEKKS